MKARELKALLATVDDDVEVVTPEGDHSYEPVHSARLRKAERVAKNRGYRARLFEHFGDEHMSPGSTVAQVFVINAG